MVYLAFWFLMQLLLAQFDGDGDDSSSNNDDDSDSGGGDSGDGEESKTFSLAYVKRLRAEAAKHRQAAKEKADLLAAKEREQLSKEEQLAKENSELKEKVATLSTTAQRAAIRDALDDQDLQVRHPRAVLRMIDLSEVEFDDKGKPKNLKELLADIRKEFPEGFGAGSSGSANGGSGNRGRRNGLSMNDMIRRAAGRTV